MEHFLSANLSLNPIRCEADSSSMQPWANRCCTATDPVPEWVVHGMWLVHGILMHVGMLLDFLEKLLYTLPPPQQPITPKHPHFSALTGFFSSKSIQIYTTSEELCLSFVKLYISYFCLASRTYTVI